MIWPKWHSPDFVAARTQGRWAACKLVTLDYEASAAKLAEWLASMRAHDWNPTKTVREHRALAKQLESMADLLDEPQWEFLEYEVNNDPTPETGRDGLPVARVESNAGRYQGTVMRLREIADAARLLAAEYPNSRAKPELGQAAIYFLHVWLEDGRERPTLYDHSPAVSAFSDILDEGGYVLSPERVRGILAKAIQTFDPHHPPPGFDIGRFLVYRQ